MLRLAYLGSHETRIGFPQINSIPRLGGASATRLCAFAAWRISARCLIYGIILRQPWMNSGPRA